MWRNLGLLVLTLALFAAAGLMNFSVTSLLLVMPILIIHEGGHWLGMRWSGYSDVKMFFIPFFGAAVSGRPPLVVDARKEAAVVLLGPLPGIFIGLAVALFAEKMESPLWMEYARLSVWLNLFNLLPIFPLDGGRLLNAVLFSRNAYLEVIFKVVALLCLGLLAYLLSSIFLGVLAFLMVAGAREGYYRAEIIGELRRRHRGMEPPANECLPREILDEIKPLLAVGLGGAYGENEEKRKVKSMALRAMAAWTALFRRAPGVWATAGLLVVYAGSVLIGVMILMAIIFSGRTSKIVERRGADGGKERVEIITTAGLRTEMPLNAEDHYDGHFITSSKHGLKVKEGDFADGWREGDWKEYDGYGRTKT